MKKLTKRWQIVLYAVSGMGINMLNLMMGSYLCSALLIGGFKGDAVTYQTFAQRDLVVAAAWGTFVLIAKVFDGIIDVPMAAYTDTLRSRWGRRRPAIVLGLVPMIASYLLFLVIPDGTGVSWLNTVWYGVILCAFYAFYTLTMVTYYATFTEIVATERERNLLSNVKSVCDIVYFILGYVVVRMLLGGLNIRPVALIVLPLAGTMLIPLFMIKEESTKDRTDLVAEGKVGLIPSLCHTFRNRPFIVWMIVYSFMTFGVQLFLGGINEYFSFVGMNMITVMCAAFVPVPFTLVLYNRITEKRGFGFSFRCVLFAFSVGMLAMFGVSFLGEGTLKTVLSVVTGLAASFSIGALFSVAYSVPAELAAEEAARTGISNAAMYFAVQGLFSGVATGIGTGVVLTALKGTEEAASGAIFYLTVISAAGTLLAALLTFALPASILKMGAKSEK